MRHPVFALLYGSHARLSHFCQPTIRHPTQWQGRWRYSQPNYWLCKGWKRQTLPFWIFPSEDKQWVTMAAHKLTDRCDSGILFLVFVGGISLVTIFRLFRVGPPCPGSHLTLGCLPNCLPPFLHIIISATCDTQCKTLCYIKPPVHQCGDIPLKKGWLLTVFREGVVAAKAGVSMSKNPYRHHPDMAAVWDGGRKEGKEFGMAYPSTEQTPPLRVNKPKPN